MHRYLIFAIGLLVLVVLFAPSLERLGTAGPNSDAVASAGDGGAGVVGPPQLATPASANIAAAPAMGGMTIDRDASGKFTLSADVNGHPVHFLIDTGADGVALTEADAAAVGITVDPSAFTPVANTASGTGYGAHVQLDRIEIAGQDISGVDAVVLRGLGVSLIGQSVLRRIGSVSVTGDRMVIGK